MNPPPEGWHLVLEFVRVLAAPTAAVVGVWLASKMAIRAFRAQKLIERRLDWYEAMMKAVSDAALAYSRAARDEPNGVDGAREALMKGMLLSAGALMWADETGARAMEEWMLVTSSLTPAASATLEDARAYRRACSKASGALARETRKDVRLPVLEFAVREPRKTEGERGGE